MWRETVSAPPRSGQGWPVALHLTLQSRCGLDIVCSGGAGHIFAHCPTAEIIYIRDENKTVINMGKEQLQ